VIVDVFADTPLQGNQLAVSEDGPALSDDQMQRLAREMNLRGTVFLLPAEDGDARMPIFTPSAQLASPPHRPAADALGLPARTWRGSL
jgi:trans-2,3-dihydro-3-hydroxyanthranilate isomerase